MACPKPPLQNRILHQRCWTCHSWPAASETRDLHQEGTPSHGRSEPERREGEALHWGLKIVGPGCAVWGKMWNSHGCPSGYLWRVYVSNHNCARGYLWSIFFWYCTLIENSFHRLSDDCNSIGHQNSMCPHSCRQVEPVKDTLPSCRLISCNFSRSCFSVCGVVGGFWTLQTEIKIRVQRFSLKGRRDGCWQNCHWNKMAKTCTKKILVPFLKKINSFLFK